MGLQSKDKGPNSLSALEADGVAFAAYSLTVSLTLSIREGCAFSELMFRRSHAQRIFQYVFFS